MSFIMITCRSSYSTSRFSITTVISRASCSSIVTYKRGI
nr:MAG TPA: hypothetical protein [Bacteriophage sp.]